MSPCTGRSLALFSALSASRDGRLGGGKTCSSLAVTRLGNANSKSPAAGMRLGSVKSDSLFRVESLGDVKNDSLLTRGSLPVVENDSFSAGRRLRGAKSCSSLARGSLGIANNESFLASRRLVIANCESFLAFPGWLSLSVKRLFLQLGASPRGSLRFPPSPTKGRHPPRGVPQLPSCPSERAIARR